MSIKVACVRSFCVWLLASWFDVHAVCVELEETSIKKNNTKEKHTEHMEKETENAIMGRCEQPKI